MYPSTLEIEKGLYVAIERIGFGRGQLLALIGGGGAYLCDGSELLVLGVVNRRFGEMWSLNGFGSSMLVSLIFVGVMIGSGVSGLAAERFGRKSMILACYIGILLVSGITAVTSTYLEMILCRFSIGFFFGIGVPAWNSIAIEISPAGWRLPQQAISQSLFCVGEIFAAVVILFLDPNIRGDSWREIVVIAALPSLLCSLFALLFLRETPHFYVTKNEPQNAKAALIELARRNQVDPQVLDLTFLDAQYNRESDGGLMDESTRRRFHLSPPYKQRKENNSSSDKLSVLLSRRYLFPTVVTCLSCSVVNACQFGLLYAIPISAEAIKIGGIFLSFHQHIIFQSDSIAINPATVILLTTVTELAGYPLSVLYGSFLSRSSAMTSATLSVGGTLFSFSFCYAWGLQTAALLCIMASKMCVSAAFVLVYLYAGEIYPTSLRTLGMSLCITAGRLGAIFSPIVFEWIRYTVSQQLDDPLRDNKSGSVSVDATFVPFFSLLGLCSLIVASLLHHLPSRCEREPLRLFHDERGIASPEIFQPFLSDDHL